MNLHGRMSTENKPFGFRSRRRRDSHRERRVAPDPKPEGSPQAIFRTAFLALLIVVSWFAERPRLAVAQATPATSTPTPVVSLVRLRQSYTIPGDVVAGHAFELYVVLENISAFDLEDVSVTFGLDPYGTGPEPIASSNVRRIGALRPAEQTSVYQRLRYANNVAGRQTLDLRFEYRYRTGDRWITRAEGAVVAIVVTPPTATPTPTTTPTATATATATPTPTITPTPTVAPPTPTRSPIPPSPTAIPTQLPESAPGPVATQTLRPESGPGGEGSTGSLGRATPAASKPVAPQPLVVVETYHASQMPVWSGWPFTLTLTLRNVGAADAYRILVEWNDASIVPLGSGVTRYLPSVPANTTTRLEGQFFVKERIALGLYEPKLRITYERADVSALTREETLYLLVAASPQGTSVPAGPLSASATPAPAPTREPTPKATPTPTPESWWLRLLRAIFGGGGSR